MFSFNLIFVVQFCREATIPCTSMNKVRVKTGNLISPRTKAVLIISTAQARITG